MLLPYRGSATVWGPVLPLLQQNFPLFPRECSHRRVTRGQATDQVVHRQPQFRSAVPVKGGIRVLGGHFTVSTKAPDHQRHITNIVHPNHGRFHPQPTIRRPSRKSHEKNGYHPGSQLNCNFRHSLTRCRALSRCFDRSFTRRRCTCRLAHLMGICSPGS